MHWNFHRDYIQSLDDFGAETQDIFLFIWVLFNLFQQCFTGFGIKSFTLNLFLSILYFGGVIVNRNLHIQLTFA